jgi:DNA-binding IclR family transcriptional regulator
MSVAEGRSVVEGAFRVLRALPDTGPDRQLAQLSRLTGLPRPTVDRLLGQLSEADVVEWRDGRWALAAGLLGLAQRVEPLSGLRRSATLVIQALHDETGAAVSLVVPADDAYVALEMVPARDPLPIDARAGAAMPADTAAGIVLGGTAGPRRRRYGAAVDDQHLSRGMTCYAVPVRLPGGARAALQIATGADHGRTGRRSVHRAGAELERRIGA